MAPKRVRFGGANDHEAKTNNSKEKGKAPLIEEPEKTPVADQVPADSQGDQDKIIEASITMASLVNATASLIRNASTKEGTTSNNKRKAGGKPPGPEWNFEEPTIDINIPNIDDLKRVVDNYVKKHHHAFSPTLRDSSSDQLDLFGPYPHPPGMPNAYKIYHLHHGGLPTSKYKHALFIAKVYHATQKSHFMGYQCNQALNYTTSFARYLDTHVDNIGDAFVEGNFTVNSKFMERALLDYVYATLWHAKWPHYMMMYLIHTASLTEGNLFGIWNAKDYLAGKKILIDNNATRKRDLDGLATLVEFFASRGYPIFICFNYGTTFKGAYDDVALACSKLHPILEKYNLLKREVYYDEDDPTKFDVRTGYWFHVDGTLGAAYMPYIEMAYDRGLVEHKGPTFDFSSGCLWCTP
ncbi:hypothetical protein L7F22_031317 [Adiantum nelumboides]|nr:hypothetical protein [Adiantum nelumboides]